MATNENKEFVQLFMLGGGLLNKHLYKKFCQNTYSEIAIKAYLHFSYYKSIETLSFHIT